MSESTRGRRGGNGFMYDHIDAIAAAGDTRVATIMDRPVVLLTLTSRRTGEPKPVPLMRVEHEGVYAGVASNGGSREHPKWFADVEAHPDVLLQDGTETREVRARVLEGAERDEWWARAVAAYPPYADYQTKTERQIPVFVLEPR